MHPAIDPSHRALYFRVTCVTDQNDLPSLIGVSLTFNVHFRDQWTGRVNYRKAALAGSFLDGARYPVGAEDGDRAGWDLIDLVDETRTLCTQPVDDMPIVNDFVTHIYWRAVFFERTLDDLDRSFDSCAETPGLG
jgi:hypothetical protein